MKINAILLVTAWLLLQIALPTQAKPLQLPDIQVTPISDSINNRNYELYVKLPKSYHQKTSESKSTNNNAVKRYPVIYYTDAMWHVESLSSATAFLMEEAILVGISWQTDIDKVLTKDRGPYVSRFRDYSISKSSDPEKQGKYQFGHAAEHLSFIRNEVIPYVENTYRTDPANRSYFGYSLGGLFGAYILLTQPDTFKNYILGSPSVWRLSKLTALASPHQIKSQTNLFISYGSKETKLGKHVDEFIDYLKNKKDKELIVTKMVPEGTHGSAFPLTAVQSVTWLSKIYQEGAE